MESNRCIGMDQMSLRVFWKGPNVLQQERNRISLACSLPLSLPFSSRVFVMDLMFVSLQNSLVETLPLKMKVLEGTAFGKQRELDEVMREEHLFPLSFSLCEDTRSELLESYKMSLTRKRPCWTMNSNF